jgi:hypothetical protein
MGSDTSYNGWSNYATWRVSLEVCDDFASSWIGERTFETLDDLADALREEVAQWVDTFAGDADAILLGWIDVFLQEIDWLEIALASSDELVEPGEED